MRLVLHWIFCIKKRHISEGKCIANAVSYCHRVKIIIFFLLYPRQINDCGWTKTNQLISNEIFSRNIIPTQIKKHPFYVSVSQSGYFPSFCVHGCARRPCCCGSISSDAGGRQRLCAEWKTSFLNTVQYILVVFTNIKWNSRHYSVIWNIKSRMLHCHHMT